MMTVVKTREFLVCALLALACCAAFWLAYPHLPARIPAHWNFQGVVDRYGSPMELLWVGPGMMLGMLALFVLLPWLSPQRFRMDSFLPTYLYLMLVVVALFGYLFAALLWIALGGALDLARALLGGVAVMLVLMGNVLGKVRRNFFMGVRTPWTLASERVWHATHRMAAKTMVAGGVLSLALVLAGAAAWSVTLAFTLAALLPVPYSLFLYKQLERRGELDSHGNGGTAG